MRCILVAPTPLGFPHLRLEPISSPGGTAMPKRYEREIEDLLSGLNFGDPEAPQRRPTRNPAGWRQRLSRGWSALAARGSRRQWMLISFLLVIVAFGLGLAAPGAAAVVGVVALLLFVLAYFSSFVRPEPRHEKRWRGRVVDLRPESISLWRRLTQRFGKGKKRQSRQ